MRGMYEREFRSILQGDKDILSKVTKTCSPDEKDNYFNIFNKPFSAIRAAGSFGVDLVAVRGDIAFLVEVKSSVEDTIHFSQMNGKLQQQAELMFEECEKTRTLPLYAYRLKKVRGDSWRIFTLDIPNLNGRMKLLQQRLPKIDKTKSGNYVMRWKEGMMLSKFISYLCHL